MKLSDVNLLAGALTGKGAMGKALAQGFGGILPAAIARREQREDAEEAQRNAAAEAARQQALAASAAGQPMKKGGAVKAKGWGKARGVRGAKVY